METNFYVYAHYTLDTNELFYIGKGKDYRYRETAKRNKYWQQIVKVHGFRPEILIDGLSEPDSFIQEILGILEYKPRANITKGGVGGFTGLNSGNFKKGTKPWNTGKICQSISDRQTGDKNHRFGKKSSRRVRIICTTDGRIFDSVLDTCLYYGLSRGSINACLNGRGVSSHGMKFKYLDNEDLNILAANNRKNRDNGRNAMKTPIIASKDGTDRRFCSIHDASRELSLSAPNIAAVLAGRRNHTGGYNFKYEEVSDE